MHAVRWIIVGLVLTALAATGATARAEPPEAVLQPRRHRAHGAGRRRSHSPRRHGFGVCRADLSQEASAQDVRAGEDRQNVSEPEERSRSSQAQRHPRARGISPAANRVEADALVDPEETEGAPRSVTERDGRAPPSRPRRRCGARALADADADPIDVQAEIAELNGDTGATATVTLSGARRFSERAP